MLTKKTSVRIISDESHPLVIDDAPSAAGGQRRQSLQNVAKLKRVVSVGRGFRKPGSAGGANGASASSLGSGAPTSNPQSYHRISVDGVESEKDYTDSAEPIAKCLLAREQYKTIDQGEMEDSSPFDQDAAGSKQFLENIVTEQTSNLVFPMKKGVFSFEGMVTKPVEWKKYVNDVKMMFSIVENGPCLATARGRLIALEEKFELYSLMNTELEEEADRFRRGGGVYARNTRVDNNVRLATLATAPQLTEFLKSTADATPHVPFTENKSTEPHQLLSFKSTLERCGIADPQAITVEGLGLHPRLYRGRFQPFDVFQEKLNPAGQQSSDILNALVEMEAPNRGELFACLVRPMLERAEFADGQVVAYDMKLPIRGRHSEEWRNVASWVYRQGFHQFSRVMWTVDLQREEEPARLGYNCQTHADHYKHMFLPLMLATASPHDPRYSEISAMLLKVGQFNLALGTAPRQRSFFSEEVPRDPALNMTIVEHYRLFISTLSSVMYVTAINMQVLNVTLMLPAFATVSKPLAVNITFSLWNALNITPSQIVFTDSARGPQSKLVSVTGLAPGFGSLALIPLLTPETSTVLPGFDTMEIRSLITFDILYNGATLSTDVKRTTTINNNNVNTFSLSMSSFAANVTARVLIWKVLSLDGSQELPTSIQNGSVALGDDVGIIVSPTQFVFNSANAASLTRSFTISCFAKSGATVMLAVYWSDTPLPRVFNASYIATVVISKDWSLQLRGFPLVVYDGVLNAVTFTVVLIDPATSNATNASAIANSPRSSVSVAMVPRINCAGIMTLTPQRSLLWTQSLSDSPTVVINSTLNTSRSQSCDIDFSMSSPLTVLFSQFEPAINTSRRLLLSSYTTAPKASP
ncbi:Hypothetical protein, putative, partial [Bodo saltans]